MCVSIGRRHQRRQWWSIKMFTAARRTYAPLWQVCLAIFSRSQSIHLAQRVQALGIDALDSLDRECLATLERTWTFDDIVVFRAVAELAMLVCLPPPARVECIRVIAPVLRSKSNPGLVVALRDAHARQQQVLIFLSFRLDFLISKKGGVVVGLGGVVVWFVVDADAVERHEIVDTVVFVVVADVVDVERRRNDADRRRLATHLSLARRRPERHCRCRRRRHIDDDDDDDCCRTVARRQRAACLVGARRSASRHRTKA